MGLCERLVGGRGDLGWEIWMGKFNDNNGKGSGEDRRTALNDLCVWCLFGR